MAELLNLNPGLVQNDQDEKELLFGLHPNAIAH